MNSFYIKYKTKLSQINYLATLLFIFWLPLKDDFLPVTLAFWILTWLLEGNFKGRIKSFPFKLLYLSMLVYFSLTVISLFYTRDLQVGFFQVQEKLSMVFFPIFLAGSNQKVKQNYKNLLYVFVVGNFVASLYCLANAFATSLVIENGSYSLHHYMDSYYVNYSFWEMVNLRYSHFSYTYLSIFKHPSYFSMYIIFSIIIIIYLIRIGHIKKIWARSLGIFCMLFFIFMLYLLQSRAGIISFAAVLIGIPIMEIKQKMKKKYFFPVLIIIVAFIYFIFSNSMIGKSVSGLKESFNNPKGFSLMKSDIRLQSWYTSIKVIEENFWFGTSPANLTQELTNKYNLYGFEVAKKEQLNAHNQYLETFAGLGVFGFLSLMFFLIYGVSISLKKNNYLLFFLLLIFSINFLFESMLNRMAGVLFLMFFVSLFVFSDIGEFDKKTG